MTIEVLHGRFRTAASYYTNGRPPYSATLIRRVVAHAGLKTDDNVLDIGTGPGLLAVAFAPYAAKVLAIDPEPEMLKQASANAAASNARISLLEASSNDISAKLGHFKLVTIGRAFHWMDRADTLRRLDTIVESDGSVALFRDLHPKVPDNQWSAAYDAALAPFRLGDKAIERGPDWPIHETFLLESRFPFIERISVIERRETPIEHFVNRALSLGAVWHKRDPIDGRLDEGLRAALAPFVHAGTVTEVVESEALIASRSQRTFAS